MNDSFAKTTIQNNFFKVTSENFVCTCHKQSFMITARFCGVPVYGDFSL